MISRNKSLRHEYEIIDRFEAGIVLRGEEVPIAKKRGINFDGSYVKIVGGEAMLINASIESGDIKRTRKLLLHKKEIEHIMGKLSQKANLSLVPVKMYQKKGFVKLEIALAKGRKVWEVKKVVKERDEKKRVQKELKEYLKS